MNKQTKTGRLILYLLMAGFLFLSVSQDYLHNHSPWEEGHNDCPVFLFQRALQLSPGLGIAIFIFILVTLFKFCHFYLKLQSQDFFIYLGSRAPPFVV
jgi:hypothetical protein